MMLSSPDGGRFFEETVVAQEPWYSTEAYIDPYGGEREEMTAHFKGITDEGARAIYTEVFGRPSV